MDEAFSARLRKAVADLIVCPCCGARRHSMREIALASGVPEATMRRFMKGHPLRLATVDKLIVWLDANGQRIEP